MQSTHSVRNLCEQARISRRLCEALLHNGFTELQDLSGYTGRRLRMLRGFGPSTIAELVRLLAETGIELEQESGRNAVTEVPASFR